MKKIFTSVLILGIISCNPLKLDMKHGDKGKSIIAFVHNTHRDWEVELDYPINFSPFVKK